MKIRGKLLTANEANNTNSNNRNDFAYKYHHSKTYLKVNRFCADTFRNHNISELRRLLDLPHTRT